MKISEEKFLINLLEESKKRTSNTIVSKKDNDALMQIGRMDLGVLHFVLLHHQIIDVLREQQLDLTKIIDLTRSGVMSEVIQESILQNKLRRGVPKTETIKAIITKLDNSTENKARLIADVVFKDPDSKAALIKYAPFEKKLKNMKML